MTDVVLAPDERALRAHLDSGRFQAGVEVGRWRLASLEWPIVVTMVSAPLREGAPEEFAIRFDLEGYPNTAPAGCIWNIAANTPLAPDLRPKGVEVEQIFRTDGWAGGPNNMYAPWDRVALQTHPNWLQEAPHLAWHPGRDLAFVLDNLHRVFNNDAYLGI
jgi:hypothetical protein